MSEATSSGMLVLELCSIRSSLRSSLPPHLYSVPSASAVRDDTRASCASAYSLRRRDIDDAGSAECRVE